MKSPQARSRGRKEENAYQDTHWINSELGNTGRYSWLGLTVCQIRIHIVLDRAPGSDLGNEKDQTIQDSYIRLDRATFP